MPWLRMHSGKASNDCACDEALGLWPDEPQAAIATTQTAPVSASGSEWRRRRVAGVGMVAEIVG
jgi:hypothetical protein